MSGLGPNAEAVRRAFERWNSGDRRPPVEDVHPDVEIRTAIGNAFQGEPFRGHAGLGEWLGGLDESFERWEAQVDEFREQGDTVVGLGRVLTRGRGSGVELELEVGWLFEFKDGKVLRIYSFVGHDQALRAAGLE